MEEIKVADVSRYVSFYAYDSANHIDPADGITGFTVRYYLNNGSSTAMTTPTVTEKDSTNMKGYYTLAVDEAGMVSAAGVVSILLSATGMDDVPIKILIIGNTTKEVYDVVAHVDYGNAHLVRSTTPANTLDVSGTGEAGLDFDNIKDATGAHTLTNVTVPTVTTLTGHTAQTGDSYARIGAAGASLSDLGGMSTGMKTEVESEANDALVALKLDHLVNIAVDTDWATTVHLDSVIGQMADVGSSATYDRTQESLEAIRARGDAEWITATGFNTTTPPTVSEIVDEWESQSQADPTGFNVNVKEVNGTAQTANDNSADINEILLDTGTNGVLLAATATSAQLVDDAWDEILTGATHNITDSAGKRLRELYDGNVTEEETAQAGAASTITLAAGSSALDDFYNLMVLTITDGTGAGQARTIKDYNGTSKVATVCMDWVTNPDNTSKYIFGFQACAGVFQMQSGVYDLINAECDTALTDYGANTTVPDAAGTAATLHGITDGKVDAVQTDTTAIKAKTDNLPDGIKKNTSITAFTFLMVDSTDHVTSKTGLTVAGNYSGDGGAVAALTNTGAITEISNGLYEIDLTSGELNYENVTLIFTATGADARVITIHTST